MGTESFGYPLDVVILLFATVIVSVAVDLWVHRDAGSIGVKDATFWFVIWVSLAGLFYIYLYARFGSDPANLFLAGYLLEKSLSVDNMMVFVPIFASFGISGILQHRILYYGIFGALIFRAVFVAVGTSLFNLSPIVELLFAAIVAWSAWLLLKPGSDDEDTDYSNHWSVRLTRRWLPVIPKLMGKRFIVSHDEMIDAKESDGDTWGVVRNGAFYATPALLCLLCIETSDIIFSFDSVPAIIGITQEPLLVYSAVIFAILGLRNLYFVLAIAVKYLIHLEKAVAFVLIFVAAKLAASSIESAFGITTFHVTPMGSVYVVIGMLAIGVVASFFFPEKEAQAPRS